MPRRPNRWLRRIGLPVMLIAIFLLARWAPRAPTVPGDPQQVYRVVRVVDGDTLLLPDKLRVRLLGIDTPERARDGQPAEPLAEEAKRFLEEFVADKPISLGFDQDPFDDYGRRLVYVYHRGVLVNEEIIRAGYSRAETGFPYSDAMKQKFRRAEHEAKDRRRGLWKLPAPSPTDE